MAEVRVGRAFAMAAPVVLTLVFTLFLASYLLTSLLGLPANLGIPLPLRLFGGAVVMAGLLVIGWTFRYRSPADMIVSTYVTLTKALRRIPATERAGRTEPLVVSGPQKFTRNPLYFGVVVIVFGWAIAGTSTFVFVAALVILAWFSLLMIPFEERELRALFGEQWVRYSEDTPMLIPFTKRRRRRAPHEP